MREGEHRFIKDNIMRDIHAVSRDMETLIALMKGTVSKKHALFRSKFKLALVIRAEMRPTRTTKHLKECVVGYFTK